MRKLVSCAIAVVALGTAGVAQAGSLSLTGDVVTYAAAASESNRVLVAVEEEPVRGVRVVDIGAPVTAGTGCASVGTNEGFCATPELPDDIVVTLDDQNDYVNTSAVNALPIRLEGGDGNDNLNSGQNQFAVQDGGPGADMFSGEGATVDYSSRANPLTVSVSDNVANDGETGENDLVTSDVQGILGGHGADTITLNQEFDTFVSGGPGNDQLVDHGGEFNELSGGPGDDFLQTYTVDSTLRGGDGDDTLIGGNGDQDLYGGDGADLLRGGTKPDFLSGGRGADELIGGTGRDHVRGGSGNDTFRARDGEADSLSGDRGTDRAHVDTGLDHLSNIEKLF